MDSLSEYLNPMKIMQDKHEYKKVKERTQELPEDYAFVFEKVTSYMFMYATGTGRTVVAILEKVLDQFEEGSKAKKTVFDITGKDVAAYCDNLLQDAGIVTETVQEKLNREIAEKLGL